MAQNKDLAQFESTPDLSQFQEQPSLLGSVLGSGRDLYNKYLSTEGTMPTASAPVFNPAQQAASVVPSTLSAILPHTVASREDPNIEPSSQALIPIPGPGKGDYGNLGRFKGLMEHEMQYLPKASPSHYRGIPPNVPSGVQAADINAADAAQLFDAARYPNQFYGISQRNPNYAGAPTQHYSSQWQPVRVSEFPASPGADLPVLGRYATNERVPYPEVLTFDDQTRNAPSGLANTAAHENFHQLQDFRLSKGLKGQRYAPDPTTGIPDTNRPLPAGSRAELVRPEFGGVYVPHGIGYKRQPVEKEAWQAGDTAQEAFRKFVGMLNEMYSDKGGWVHSSPAERAALKAKSVDWDTLMIRRFLQDPRIKSIPPVK